MEAEIKNAGCPTGSNIPLKKTSLRVLVLMFVNLTVWLAGGLTFMYLEGSSEAVHKCGVKRVKRDFLDALWEQARSTDEIEWKSVARRKLESFEEEIYTAVEAGQSSVSGQATWTPLNAILYTFTIATTIGYGSLTPADPWVRLASLLYAGLACPLFALLIKHFSDLLLIILSKTLSSWQAEKPNLRLITITLILHSTLGSFLLLFLYEWSLQDSLYFLGSTFTTVGFGDIVPQNNVIFFMLGIYIITGLSLYGMYQDAVVENLSGWLERWLSRPQTKLHQQ